MRSYCQRTLPGSVLLIALLTISMTAVAAPNGARLYQQHCSACHGSTGEGGVGVPLALPSFLSSVDNRFLETTIRQGRPGRVMPAFPALSDAQVLAIVTFIRSWSEKVPPRFETTPISGNLRHGRLLFQQHCMTCHGDQGKGGSGTGVTFSRKRDLPIIAPALNNPGFLAAASDELIKHTLMLGREGTPMRSFLVQGLDEEDINDLVSYVRSFSQSQPPTPIAADSSPILVVDSPYSLEETIDNLKQSIVSQNFTLIRSEFLEHGLTTEGDESKREVVLHFCNFRFLYEALAIDPRVGMFLPCRINIIETNGKVKIMTINPLHLSTLFNNDELNDACKKMHGIYNAILEDASL